MGKLIGFIGQGWIGKNYADDFEKRGYEVVRYSMEEPYVQNKEKIKDCDITFIAVPTPSTPEGFDSSILRKVVPLVGDFKTAVIKSTLLPGTTESIQKENEGKFVFHSPEFLTESTAAFDAAHPFRNIVGSPVDNDIYKEKAKEVLEVLPKAPFESICTAKEAELIKYGGNCWFYFKVIYVNMLYDLAEKLGCKWEAVRDAMAADPRIGSNHLNPVHKSGESGGEARPGLAYNDVHMVPVHKAGRGAGGHCFIKDFAAFKKMYEEMVGDQHGKQLLDEMEKKNLDLLISSCKDLDLVKGVYGEDVLKPASPAGK